MIESVEQVETPQPLPTKADINKAVALHRVMHSQLGMINIFAEEYEGVSKLRVWLKSSFDKDTMFPVKEGTTSLELKKIHHDFYLSVAHLLSTRIQLKIHEMQPIVESIELCKASAAKIRAEIELIEPPVKPEQEPFEMDLTHVQPKQESVQ